MNIENFDDVDVDHFKKVGNNIKSELNILYILTEKEEKEKKDEIEFLHEKLLSGDDIYLDITHIRLFRIVNFFGKCNVISDSISYLEGRAEVNFKLISQ